jgi:hypothetical protein
MFVSRFLNLEFEIKQFIFSCKEGTPNATDLDRLKRNVRVANSTFVQDVFRKQQAYEKLSVMVAEAMQMERYDSLLLRELSWARKVFMHQKATCELKALKKFNKTLREDLKKIITEDDLQIVGKELDKVENDWREAANRQEAGSASEKAEKDAQKKRHKSTKQDADHVAELQQLTAGFGESVLWSEDEDTQL